MKIKSKDDYIACFSVVGIILIIIILMATIIISLINNNEDQETENLDTLETEQIKTDNVINAPAISHNNDGDSTFIGNIRIGCSKAEFEKEFNSFLSLNKSLNGLTIEKHKAYFNNEKLVRLILLSKDYKYYVGGYSEKHDGWCFFYKQKYKNIYKDCYKHNNSGISIEKDLFTIDVFDNQSIINPPSSYDYDIKPGCEPLNKEQSKRFEIAAQLKHQEALDAYHGLAGQNLSYVSKVPFKVRSMIDIYDKKFIQSEQNRMKREHDDKINKQRKKDLDAI